MKIACKPADPKNNIEAVFIKEINRPFVDFCLILARVWSDFGHGEPTITSGADGKHGINSYHYKGLAWDVRIWGMSETEAEQVANALRRELTEIHHAFQAVYGDKAHKDHIHVEYDLKKAGGVIYG